MFVYKVTNVSENKSYIDIMNRSLTPNEVLMELSENPSIPQSLKSDIDRLGIENFKIESLERVMGSINRLLGARDRFIAELDPWYNKCDEGEPTPTIITDTPKQSISKTKQKSSNLGKSLPEEWKLHIKNSCSTRKSVRCIETDEVFNSVTDAASHFGVGTGSITKVCRGTSKTCKGYHFEFVDKEA